MAGRILCWRWFRLGTFSFGTNSLKESLIRPVAVKGDYDDGLGIAYYVRMVRAQKQGMVLETNDMTVKRREKDGGEVVAIGGVVVTRGEQPGTGEQAGYAAAGDSITLTGQN